MVIKLSLRNEVELKERPVFSFDYVSVSTVLIVLLLASFKYQNGFNTLFDWALFSFFISYITVVTYIDLKISYVYNLHVIVYSFAIFILHLLSKGFIIKNSVIGFLVASIFYGLIHILSKFYYEREAFGLGDVFIFSGFGLILGPIKTVIAGFTAFYVAIIIVILLTVFRVKFTKASELPFAPYIMIAVFMVYYRYDYFLMVYNYLLNLI